MRFLIANQKGRRKRPDRYHSQAACGLLDLGFLELDMLAHDGIVFAERHLFGDVARVFLGHIEKAGVSGADQFNFDRGWLRHGPFLQFVISLKTKGASAPLRSQTRANAGLAAESQEL